MVVPDDAASGVEAEAGTLANPLGREERIEDSGLDLRRDSGAVIADLHQDAVEFPCRSNSQFTFCPHSVEGVIDQVGPHLV